MWSERKKLPWEEVAELLSKLMGAVRTAEDEREEDELVELISPITPKLMLTGDSLNLCKEGRER
jgi:hypothetical protein